MKGSSALLPDTFIFVSLTRTGVNNLFLIPSNLTFLFSYETNARRLQEDCQLDAPLLIPPVECEPTKS